MIAAAAAERQSSAHAESNDFSTHQGVFRFELDEQVGTLLIPALGAVLTVYGQDHADSTVDEVEDLSSSGVRVFVAESDPKVSCLSLTSLPEQIVKVEDIIAPALYESDLDKKGRRRPKDRSDDKGADSEHPGWQPKEKVP